MKGNKGRFNKDAALALMRLACDFLAGMAECTELEVENHIAEIPGGLDRPMVHWNTGSHTMTLEWQEVKRKSERGAK